ncbi:hypothetical protein V8J36_02275 [Frigidibacter sp. MR17.14]|uniref:hypothetical protein n=1 Tax=Frigidibacter sp. MR17.14 TaxID=3126509 RepID=UPI003012AAC6
MPEIRITDARIRFGRWEAELVTDVPLAEPPEALHEGVALPGVESEMLDAAAGRWRVAVPIPPQILSDGVQTVLVRLRGAPEALARFTIVTGQPLDEDLRAEIDLLRAELDLLKRAFRQHVAAGAEGPAATVGPAA